MQLEQLELFQDARLAKVIEIVTAWRHGHGTEVSAARHLYELAVLLGIDPPPPRSGLGKTMKIVP